MTTKHGPRVLIARLSAIGDTIFTAPVACALRDRYPGARITWVVEEKSATFVRNHPAIDQTVVVPRGWFTSWRGLRAVRAELRRCGPFDAAVDAQGMTKSAVACWLSGAPMRIGLLGEHGRELSPWLNNRLVRPEHTHITDRSLELLGPLGIHRPQVRWDLPDDESAERTIGTLVRGSYPTGYAVVNPGATWESKLWETNRFGQVAAELGRRRTLRTLVVWAGDREREAAGEVVAASDGWAKVAPPTSLMELAALLRRASVVLSADTGPLHLATAVGAPAVGLYGPTRPEDCGPYGDRAIALQSRYQSGTRRERRRAGNDAMREITAEQVVAACEKLLDAAPASRLVA
ncbi:Lipopolysaccharide heptosyltransferase 1 [Pseudobythopirellula maris]|uniref:Lipopolysaccharide heptosyltransferase 1 n=1 Tax=Pseudobythopirellula maris TaxID=2527991 RepID=A0A5C5ZRT0_9BACT|nr:glycosyltransferase family 9 protein [Pseudobythopirellula maris]TWT90000.1 Lipopolysaccharide heptosyltransferase 1 [Pseudobythopirellula maris]